MSQLSELIDKQQLAIDRLDNILSNLSKLGIDKRTREVLGKAFEKAGKNWDEILSNHKNLVEQGIPDDPTYFEKLNNAVIIGEKIESFITKHFPDLVQISLTKCALELFIELPKSSRNVDNGNEISEEDVSEGSSSRQAPTLEDELFQEFLNFKKTKEKEALNSEEKETARKQAEKFQEILNCQKLKEENEIKVKNENSQIAMLMQMVANQQRWMEMQNKVESPKHGGLRLPQVDLLSFDGNIKNYKAFQDIFETVMKKSQLDPIERFTILRSKLSGDALNAVINLSLTEGNYLIAWEILNKRFLNKRISIEVNMKDIIFGPETVAKKADSLLQFMQGYQNAMHNLKDLGIDVNVESGCWMYPIMKRMDSYTLSRFEDFIGCTSEMPTVDQLNTFMEQEYSVNVRRQEEEPKKIINSATTRTYATMDQREFRTSDQKQFKCFLCKENHAVINCSIFKTSEDRIALLKEHKLCIYCGKHKWMYQVPCQQRDRLKCEIEDCGQQHLTELHPKSRISKSFLSKNESQDSSSGVIIPTAIINVLTDENNITKVRCLIDQCSQGSYITEDLVQKLKLKKKRINVKIIGVGGVEVGHVQSLVTIQIKLDDPSLPVIKTKAFVVRKVTSKLPAIPMHIDLNNNDKKLADPFFNKPAHIPILLGSNVLVHIFSNGTEKINNLLYQNTLLGWIVSGSTSNIMAKQVSTHVSINEFEDKLIKFWDMPIKQATEIEEISDEHCEKLYQDQVTRNQEGRYMVPTPWKKDAPELGSSYNKAVSFFLGQENRWYKNPTHKQKSDEFMKEYLELGHMSPIPLEEQKDKSGDAYYIPYISILRKDAVTTKLRNVFNASSPSSNGITLNNQIHSGPKLQTHIFDLITSVRKHQFIYSSDVTKMYRQILIKPEDREKHRVIWRPSRDYPLMEYRLNTITYGLDCAPWQAIRTLHQIADDNAPDEQTKDIIKKGFYMDDLLDGNETIEQCQEQIGKIISTLEAGKLSLTKWVANDSRILANIEPAKKISAYIQLTDSEPSVKTLGLLFNPNDDFFSFKVKEYPDVTYTKRGLLSIAASLYDPIGWILPVVMKFRILVQSLWQLTYDWDDKIDVKTQRKFEKSLASIAQLGEVQIPRWTGNTNKSSIHFIGFCDASQDAYAAVIYSRVQVKEGFQICLIASKGRVTPLKTKVNQESKVCTIPKLELEGIVLLMELYEDVSKNYTNLNITFTVYTDSEVALAWVRNHKELNNKFIKRRVAKIRQVIKPFDIHYVKSAENPADPASRGLNTDQLLDCHIWFNGPDWLHNETLPTTPFKEEITTTTYVSQVKELNETSFLERFSNWNHLRRTVARILRWKNKNSGPITAEEIATAEKRIVKYQQQRTFQKELKLLSKNLSISPKHWLSMLTPYINNDDGFLRVGGRIGNAGISNEQKHPILLVKCHLVDMIIKHVHLEHGHSGNSLTERLIRETYWIPSIKGRIKKCVRSCPTCIRWRAKTVQPIMADLPTERVNSGPIFGKIGVDLCGPFNIKASRIKFDKTIKVWVAIFICLVSKATHLEICSDLSTDNFLAAFSRFINRRGCPSLVMSDNGTNFCGANRKIQEGWCKIIMDCKERTAIQHIQWTFIPPYSPTFGGLWEAAVKSMKFFVRRMTNVENLNQEEFGTLLCRIEGLLNSRPLYPGSTDPSDPPALTPFHLLAQRTLKASPDDYSIPDKSPVTKKWLSVKLIQQQFWERFQQEYLSHLQKKYKWKNTSQDLEIGDLVLMQEPNLPPATWKMGRIIESFPDKNGVSRQYDVKTSKQQVVRRSAKRLVPLLPEEHDEVSM